MAQQKAMQDPEIQLIMTDPIMRQVPEGFVALCCCHLHGAAALGQALGLSMVCACPAHVTDVVSVTSGRRYTEPNPHPPG